MGSDVALPIPHRDEPVASYDERTKTVAINDNWHRFLGEISGSLTTLFSAFGGSPSSLGTAAFASATQAVGAPFVFKSPEDETVRLIIKCPFAFTITETTTRTAAGTSTVAFSINGTPLGGSSNSASTSEQSQAHSTANAVAVGDDVEVTFSSTTSCDRLSVMISGTRTMTS